MIKPTRAIAEKVVAFSLSFIAHLIFLLAAAHLAYTLAQAPVEKKPLLVTFRKMSAPPQHLEPPKVAAAPAPGGAVRPLERGPEPAGGKILPPKGIGDFEPKSQARNIVAPGLPVKGEGPARQLNLFAARIGPNRGKYLAEGGGSGATESAANLGLVWLSKHQDDDGSWDARGFGRHCPPGDVCSGQAVADIPEARTGVTGLALLAFLGSGYTHQTGEFRQTVARGLKYILSQQADDGSFNDKWRVNYVNAICTLVCIECFALSDDRNLVGRIDSGLTYLAQHQQPEGGWDYGAQITHRNDTSVTGWVILALKAGNAVGWRTPWQTDYGLLRFMAYNTAPNGTVHYALRTTDTSGTYQNHALLSGMLCARQYLGLGEIPLAERQACILQQDFPGWRQLKTDHLGQTFYYWYYGTLANFNMGEPYWPEWNKHMTQTLLTNMEQRGHKRGSWDPKRSNWENAYGGRVMSTALSVLNLEVYYRYMRTTLAAQQDHLPQTVQFALAEETDPACRKILVDLLLWLPNEEAAKIAAGLLETGSLEEKVAAAALLARQKDRRGEEALFSFLGAQPDLQLNAQPRTQSNAPAGSQPDEQLELSAQLERKVIYGLAFSGGEKAVSALIELLGKAEGETLEAVKHALYLATGRALGFKLLADHERADAVVKLWRKWLKENEGLLADMSAQRLFARVAMEAPDGESFFLDIGAAYGIHNGLNGTIYRESGVPVRVRVLRTFAQSSQVTAADKGGLPSAGDWVTIILGEKPVPGKGNVEQQPAQ